MIQNFICEHCESSFSRYAPPSKPLPRFCSPACRNKARSLPKIPCPICGNLFHPKKSDGIHRKKHCSQSCAWSSQIKATSPSGRKRWNDKRDSFLREFYPERGAEYCSQILGVSPATILNRVCRLGITLTEGAAHNIVHSQAARYMRDHNPMHNPQSREKVRRYWENHPEEHAQKMVALHDGARRLQKDKPTKLELKLFSILGDVGVSYEPFFSVKPNFVVDVKIGNLIIQADGEYWHGHPRFSPLTDRQVAQQKRDKAQDAYLRACGFIVERVWERDMKTEIIQRILEKHNLFST